jgi:hypothetical protein
MIGWLSASGGFLRTPCHRHHRLGPHCVPFDTAMDAQRAISTPPSCRRYIYDTFIAAQRTDPSISSGLLYYGYAAALLGGYKS